MSMSGGWQPAENFQPASTDVRGTLHGFTVFPTANSQLKGLVPFITPSKGSESAKDLCPGPPSDVSFRPKQQPDGFYGGHRNSATCDVQMYRGINAYFPEGDKECIHVGGGGVAPPNTPQRLREVCFKFDSKEDSLALSVERRSSLAQSPKPSPPVLRSKSETKIKPFIKENRDGNLTPERSYSLNGSAHTSVTNLSCFKGMTSPLAEDEENASDVSKAAAFISSVVQQSLCPENINALKRERDESPSVRKAPKPTTVSPYFCASNTSGYNGTFSPLAESSRFPPLSNSPELNIVPSLKNAIAVNTIISHLNSSKQTFPRGFIESPSSASAAPTSVKPGLFSLTSSKVTEKTDVIAPLSPPRLPISSEPTVFQNTVYLSTPHTPYIPPQSHKEAISILTSHITPLIKPEKRSFVSTNGASLHPSVSLPQCVVTHCNPLETTVSATSSKNTTTNSPVTLKEVQFSPHHSAISPEFRPLSGSEESISMMEEESQKKSGSFYRGKVVKNKAVDIAQQFDSHLTCHTYSTKFPMDVICQGRLLETRRKTSPDFEYRADPNSSSTSHGYRTSRSMSTGRMESGRRTSYRISSAKDPDKSPRLECPKIGRMIASPPSIAASKVGPPDNLCLTGVENNACSRITNDSTIKEQSPANKQSTIAIVHARSRLPKLRNSHSFNVKLVEAGGRNLDVKEPLVATDIGDSPLDVPSHTGEPFSLSEVEVIKPLGGSSLPPSGTLKGHVIGRKATDLSAYPNPDSKVTPYSVVVKMDKAEDNSDPLELQFQLPPAFSKETKDSVDTPLIKREPESEGAIDVTKSHAVSLLKSLTETSYFVEKSVSQTIIDNQRGSLERKVLEDLPETRTSLRVHGNEIFPKQDDFSPKWNREEFVNIDATVPHSEHSREPHVIGTGCACPGLQGFSVETPPPIRGPEASPPPLVQKYEDSPHQISTTEELAPRSESQDSTPRISKLEDLLPRDPYSEVNVSCTPKAKDPTTHVVSPKNLHSSVTNSDLPEARGRYPCNSPMPESQGHEDLVLYTTKRESPVSVNLGISDGTESLCRGDVEEVSSMLTLNTLEAVVESDPRSVWQEVSSGGGLYQASLPEPVRPLTFVVEEMFEFIDDSSSSPPSYGIEDAPPSTPVNSPVSPTAILPTQATGYMSTESSTMGLPVQASDGLLIGNKGGGQESALISLENIPPTLTAPSLLATLSFPLSPLSLSPCESLLPKTRSTLTTTLVEAQSEFPMSQEVPETFVLPPSHHKAELVWVEEDNSPNGGPVSPLGIPSMSSIRSSVDRQIPFGRNTQDGGDIWGAASPESEEDDFESMDAEMRRLEEKLRKFEAELGIASKEEVGGSICVEDYVVEGSPPRAEDLIASSTFPPVSLLRTRHLSLEREVPQQNLLDSSSKEVNSKKPEVILRRSLDLQKLLIHRRVSRTLEADLVEGADAGHCLEDEVCVHEAPSRDRTLTLEEEVALEGAGGLMSSEKPHFGYLWREGDMTALDFEALESFTELHGSSCHKENLFFIFEDDDEDDVSQHHLEGVACQHYSPPGGEDPGGRSWELGLVTAFKRGLRKAAKYLGPNSPPRVRGEGDTFNEWASAEPQSWGRYDVRAARVTSTCPPPHFENDLLRSLEDDLSPPSPTSSPAEVHAFPVLCVLSSSEDDLKDPGLPFRSPPIPPRRGIPVSSPEAPPRSTQPQVKRRRQQERDEAPTAGSVPTPDRPADLRASCYFLAELNWPLANGVTSWPCRFPRLCFFAGLLLIVGLLFFTARFSVGA